MLNWYCIQKLNALVKTYNLPLGLKYFQTFLKTTESLPTISTYDTFVEWNQKVIQRVISDERERIRLNEELKQLFLDLLNAPKDNPFMLAYKIATKSFPDRSYTGVLECARVIALHSAKSSSNRAALQNMKQKPQENVEEYTRRFRAALTTHWQKLTTKYTDLEQEDLRQPFSERDLFIRQELYSNY